MLTPACTWRVKVLKLFTMTKLKNSVVPSDLIETSNKIGSRQQQNKASSQPAWLPLTMLAASFVYFGQRPVNGRPMSLI